MLASFCLLLLYVATTLLSLVYRLLQKPEILAALLGVMGTLGAALVGIKFAFKQIREQFRQKVTYEGWKELQQSLFDFSRKLSEHNSTIQSMHWYLLQKDNPIVNGGDSQEYKKEQWNRFNQSYIDMYEAYIAFIQAFETHEVIFLTLRNMKSEFSKRFTDTLDANGHFELEKSVFPEFSGTNPQTPGEVENMIKKYSKATLDMTIWLHDFRIQLQNLTLGKILEQYVPERIPEERHDVLKPEGFIALQGNKKT